MQAKMKNALKITVTGVDLTTVKNLEFYVRQTPFFGCYRPEVISETEMVVEIPFADARRLRTGTAKLQFAFVDANGTPRASDIEMSVVDALLKEAGYAAE